MKKRLTGYTFSAAAKTVTHADFSDITLEGIQLITNTTANIIIYNFADATKGGTLATDTLTLTYNTAAMADTDKLMILVDDAVVTLPVSLASTTITGNVTVAQATGSNLHAVIDSGTITTVSAVTAITNALPAGTNNIGDVDIISIAAGDNNIGNVDIVSSALPTGASTLVEQQSQTTALQLIDDVVYTDDTSTHATGTSKGVGVMAAAVPTDASVNANDIAMLAMTTDRKLHVAVMDALPAGTAAIGKLAANSGVDIGDVDILSVTPGTAATNLGKAEDAGHTTGDTGVYNLGVRNDTPNTALTNTDADYASLTTDRVGGIRTALYETDFAVLGTNHVKKYYTSAGAATDGIVWSPAAGKRWYVTDIFINTSAASTITLEDDLVAGDAAVWKAELAANSGWSHHFGTPLFSGEDAADLLVTTTAGNVYITVTGYEI